MEQKSLSCDYSRLYINEQNEGLVSNVPVDLGVLKSHQVPLHLEPL